MSFEYMRGCRTTLHKHELMGRRGAHRTAPSAQLYCVPSACQGSSRGRVAPGQAARLGVEVDGEQHRAEADEEERRRVEAERGHQKRDEAGDLDGQTRRKPSARAASGWKATASRRGLRRWASPHECGGQPQAFGCSLMSRRGGRRLFDHAAVLAAQVGAVALAAGREVEQRLSRRAAAPLRAHVGPLLHLHGQTRRCAGW